MKTLKQERLILIFVLLISFAMHLVYGLEGAAQVGVLEQKIDRQAAEIKDKKQQIEALEHKQEVKREVKQEELNEICLGEYTITAYCPCYKCCGKYALNRPNGIVTGAAGVELKEGVSVASPLPLGIKVIIDGKEYINQDQTSEWVAKKYDDKIIDIYFGKHEDAEAFGKQVAKVYIVED